MRLHHSQMQRPAWLRVLITLWGIWFTTALTEPAGLFACAMHSGMAIPSAVGGMAMSMGITMPASAPGESGAAHSGATMPTMAQGSSVAHHVHAAMPAPAADTSATPHGITSSNAGATAPTRAASAAVPEPTHQHDCCTCIGQCGVAVAVATPVYAVELTVATLSPVAPPAFTHHAHVPQLRAHALPFANGPPPALL